MEIRTISASAIFRAAATVLALIIALRFLWIAHAVFIVTFLGILLGLAMGRAVDWLERIHIPRGVGAPLVLILFLGLLAGFTAMIGPSLRDQTRELERELPKAVRAVEDWLNQSPAKALVPPPPQQQQQQGGLTPLLTKAWRDMTRFPIVFGMIGGVMIVLFIAMYTAAEPTLYREGILHLVSHRHRQRAEEYLTTLSTTLRQWLVARLMAMVLVGLITGFGLAALGINGAVALGILAGLMEFIPFFGPVISAIPAIAIALIDSPQKAIWVAVLYLAVQQLEGNIITPLLLEKRLDIPAVLTVVTVAAFGVVFGVLGMLIAEPLLAATMVTAKMLYVQDVVGDDIAVGKSD
jgi:predicted PurR-regulated permease PerM